jgi:NADPH:quinone reductase-like Zn-dependent oxidoreductase
MDKTMKSYHLTYGGGIDGLVLREHEIPKPGPGQVLVRVRAASLNASELMILRGDYPLPVKADLRFVAVGNRTQFVAMNRAIEVNRLRPVIDRVFSFDEAIDAFRYYQAGQFFGKIVIAHK